MASSVEAELAAVAAWAQKFDGCEAVDAATLANGVGLCRVFASVSGVADEEAAEKKQALAEQKKQDQEKKKKEAAEEKARRQKEAEEQAKKKKEAEE